MTVEQVELYRHVPYMVQTIHMVVHPLPVEYYIPEYEEIDWVVCRLLLNRSGGPLGIRAEHLHQWLHEETWDKAPDATNWQKVVSIVQEAFHNGTLVDESTWQTVILIYKVDSGDFWGVGLVEVLWKTFTSLLS